MEWYLMVKHPEWASSRDPRHLAELFNERNNALKPVSNSFDAFYQALPEEVRKRVLINRRIQKVHDQFSQVVDPFILDHTNSVYLLRHKDLLNQPVQGQPTPKDEYHPDVSQEIFDLVVYVDNSLVAAELNARRELIRLKYREQFSVVIDVFEIRISRGSYKEKYPFRELKNQEAPSKPHALTEEKSQRVDELIKDIPEGKLRDSFRKAITAQKQNHTDK